MTRTLAFFVLCAVLCVSAAGATEVAGVVVPETASLDSDQLVLNGAGVRKKFFVKVYVGALFLTRRQDTVEAVLADKGAKRISMHFLYKEVGRDKMVDGWNDGFRNNLSDAEFGKLQARLEQLNAMTETLRAGDVMRLDYVPGNGTSVWINETEKGTVPGVDFHQALLKVWLGNMPADNGLKKAMLGK
ncbi:MAG: chalcone isomerase family protein [Pseudomonadota bacterium]|nr:MAG: chalcone isomerase family protein [Pseudomonadota bacterium]